MLDGCEFLSGVCHLCLLRSWFLFLVFLPQKMFKVEAVNCICVDWRRGALTDYTQAVHNIRVVGAEIAFLIQGLSVKPCLGHILRGGGRERDRRSRQGTQRQPGRVGRGQAWKPGSPRWAFPQMKLQPSSLPECPEDP